MREIRARDFEVWPFFFFCVLYFLVQFFPKRLWLASFFSLVSFLRFIYTTFALLNTLPNRKIRFVSIILWNFFFNLLSLRFVSFNGLRIKMALFFVLLFYLGGNWIECRNGMGYFFSIKFLFRCRCHFFFFLFFLYIRLGNLWVHPFDQFIWSIFVVYTNTRYGTAQCLVDMDSVHTTCMSLCKCVLRHNCAIPHTQSHKICWLLPLRSVERTLFG